MLSRETTKDGIQRPGLDKPGHPTDYVGVLWVAAVAESSAHGRVEDRLAFARPDIAAAAVAVA